MTPKLNRTIPILRMFDVAKAREFYIDYLGFSIDFEHRFDGGAPRIETQPWGTREICVLDPFGNQLIFSEQIA